MTPLGRNSSSARGPGIGLHRSVGGGRRRTGPPTQPDAKANALGPGEDGEEPPKSPEQPSGGRSFAGGGLKGGPTSHPAIPTMATAVRQWKPQSSCRNTGAPTQPPAYPFPSSPRFRCSILGFLGGRSRPTSIWGWGWQRRMHPQNAGMQWFYGRHGLGRLEFSRPLTASSPCLPIHENRTHFLPAATRWEATCLTFQIVGCKLGWGRACRCNPHAFP